MEALRIIRTITSDRLPELINYKGKRVEIIVLHNVHDEKKDNDSILSLRGCLKTKIDGMEFQRRIRKEWERDELSF
ncbi:MAG: hypothetical protein P9X24_12640 [Candidatus Hatepunaea meridiana]|nr:hypothetical protein [Candidatus Hatepunaea meridiana]